ncbi:MAG: recombinase family protein [Cyanobacteria bacterium P01_C01_bin.89]
MTQKARTTEWLWIEGATGCGKTTRALRAFEQWLERCDRQTGEARRGGEPVPWGRSLPSVLGLASNRETAQGLGDRLMGIAGGQASVVCLTPLGFIQDAVMVFYPLVVEALGVPAGSLLLLRSENEQGLAGRLWGPIFDEVIGEELGLEMDPAESVPRIRRERWVRQLLDLGQLAAAGRVPWDQVSERLETGMAEGGDRLWQRLQYQASELLGLWKQWCLERGFLSYGIMTELFGQVLLNHPKYRQHLAQRFHCVIADDTDDFPAVMADLLEALHGGIDDSDGDRPFGVVTHNRESGCSRLGLGADPVAMDEVAQHCQAIQLSAANLPDQNQTPLASVTDPILSAVNDPALWFTAPADGPFLYGDYGDAPHIDTIETISRGQLLRETAEAIAQVIVEDKAKPEDIAVIGPGLDGTARYALTRILNERGIEVHCLNDQRPLIEQPQVRSLLTLLGLVYEGLSGLIDRDGVAEMLVVLTQFSPAEQLSLLTEMLPEMPPDQPVESEGIERSPNLKSLSAIDPVRAGLLADYCFDPDPPTLESIESYSRWDRLGYQATQAYDKIRNWVTARRKQQQHLGMMPPLVILDQAIQEFLWHGGELPGDSIADLRELLEAVQRYWDIAVRLAGPSQRPNPAQVTAELIQLLRTGAIAANPTPLTSLQPKPVAVTLATIFQYRTTHQTHPWHFWLDAGSNLWPKGGAAQLFGAPLFLRQWDRQPETMEQQLEADRRRMDRLLQDLLTRAGNRLTLCHSQLNTAGQDHDGPLAPWRHNPV